MKNFGFTIMSKAFLVYKTDEKTQKKRKISLDFCKNKNYPMKTLDKIQIDDMKKDETNTSY